MAIYQARARTTITTASAAIAAYRGDTTQETRIREIHLYNITAPTTSGAIGLVRSTALGVTPAGIVTGIRRDPNSSTTTGQLETSWATAPTFAAVATNTLQAFAHSTALGNGVIWAYDPMSPLIVPIGNTATGSLVFVNLQATAAATYDITVIWED